MLQGALRGLSSVAAATGPGAEVARQAPCDGLLRQALQQKTTSSTRDDEIDIAELHKRASIWYEENGLEIEAFHHAVTAGDLDRAASLLELAYPAMDGRFQLPTWLSLAKALPDVVAALPLPSHPLVLLMN